MFINVNSTPMGVTKCLKAWRNIRILAVQHWNDKIYCICYIFYTGVRLIRTTISDMPWLPGGVCLPSGFLRRRPLQGYWGPQPTGMYYTIMIGHSGENLGYSWVCIDYWGSEGLGLDHQGVCPRLLRGRGTYCTIMIGHSKTQGNV